MADAVIQIGSRVVQVQRTGGTGPAGPKGDKGDPGTPGSGSGKIDVVANRAALASVNATSTPIVFLQEDGREGFFEWTAGDQSADVTLDTLQGMVVAPSSATTGASGVWRRVGVQRVNVRWFGASPSATATVNTNAFKAALDWLDRNFAVGYSYEYGVYAQTLYVPAGKYLLNDTLNIRIPLIFEGDGPRSTHLKWAAGTSGIRVGRINTPDATAPSATGSGGAGDESIIRQFYLEGGQVGFDYVSYAPGNEGEFHGIELRARASIYDVVLMNWQGDGIYSLAVAGGGASEGNANLIRMFNVTAWACRNGAFLDGADTNACAIYGFNGFSCRQWGFWDSSFLANTWNGVHVDGNGVTNLSYTVANGHLYYVLAGQEAWCSANPPSGTTASNQGWAYQREVSAIPSLAWVLGRAYRAGGSFCCDNNNAFSTVNGYSESGQPPAQVSFPTKVEGGFYAGVTEFGTTLTYGGQIVAGGVGVRGIVVPQDFKAGNNISTGGRLAFTKDDAVGYTGPDMCAILKEAGSISVYAPSNPTYGYAVYNGGNVCMSFGANGSTQAEIWGDLNIRNSGKVIKLQGTQVVGPQGAAVASVASANATDLATAMTLANELKAQLNAALARLRAHGLIAA